MCRRVADSTGSWQLRDIYLLYTAVSQKRWSPETGGQLDHDLKAGRVPARRSMCIRRYWKHITCRQSTKGHLLIRPNASNSCVRRPLP
ncbi:hypothetical protein BKM09_001585 [Pseudomonas amygdali pv. morsprunorum]|nr:hypothetical protein BKM19_019090 [Pseudomonas amygdali pv. morsprunorum]POP96222.1 hypothetical protein CXB39_02535 [Pseudomonas amygdali pv. morsprunorum]POY77769.1 hypothetical protein BKM09_001585 [Pseudomonas amygdali pv. morsprunorum]